MVGETDARLVIDARAGGQESLDELVTRYLPLVYNIVGRALAGHGDVDDVVQETMLRLVRGLDGLRDPGRFRSWLVAVAMNQVREHTRRRGAAPASLDEAAELADPGADFVDLTLTELGLSGQRREVALATRWLDDDDRHLLSLWWLVTTGHLTRVELVSALEIDPHHVTVRVARMKGQLDVSRMVVRALMAAPRCPGLTEAAAQWRGEESPLWRKRFARHVRECAYCTDIANDLLPAERLLAGLGLVPLPAGYAAYMLAAAHAGHAGNAATALLAPTPPHESSTSNAPGADESTGRIPEQRAGGRHGGSHRTGSGSHGGRAGHAGRAGHSSPFTSKPLLAVLAITAAGGIGAAAIYAVESGKKPVSAPPVNSIVVSGSAVSPAGIVTLPSASATATASAAATHSSAPAQSPAPSTKPPTSAAPSTKPPVTATTTTGGPIQGTAVQQVLDAINQARSQAGLPAYTITSGLTQSSTAHDQTMAGGCGLSHQCPGEAGLGARESAAGVQWTSAGENIGEGGPVADSDAAIAQIAVQLTESMINEQPPDDGHRLNILSGSFHHVGIAVYQDSAGTVWMTQDFSS